MSERWFAGSPSPITNPTEQRIVKALASYRFLLNTQFCPLVAAKGSFTYVKTRLKHLVDGGYLGCLKIPNRSLWGRPRYVYYLSDRGRTQARRLGEDPGPRVAHAADHLSPDFVVHATAISDFQIGAELLSRSRPTFSIPQRMTDLALRHRRLPIVVSDDGASSFQTTYTPDAWLEIRGDGASFGITLEVEHAVKWQQAWRSRVRRLVAWALGPYCNHFTVVGRAGSLVPAPLTIAVVVLAGQKHLKETGLTGPSWS